MREVSRAACMSSLSWPTVVSFTTRHFYSTWVVLLCMSGLLVTDVSIATAQPDSVRTERLRAQGYPENHTPRRALWRAAAVPGWGQVYNRQYLKLPFVYAGLGGIVYNAFRNQNRYRLYRRANQFAVGRDENSDGENPFAQYEAQYNEVIDRFGQEVSPRLIREQRDAYQRQRNLMIIGTGVFYALTVVDAYVSAHLLTFDVGEDLSIQVHPTWQPSPSGAQAGVRATWHIGR